MAFRELMMVDVKEILRRWQQGHSARRIEREGVAERETVKRYVTAAVACGVTTETEVSDQVVGRVAQLVQQRTLSEPTEGWSVLTSHKEQLQCWLNEELTLVKVHELLKRRGVDVTYATLRRFAMRELQWHRPTSTVRLNDPPPGQEAQIDFGRLGLWSDRKSGRRRVAWALLITLSHSRYMFVWPCLQQRTSDVIEGLEAAWRFFGGMPRTLVPDNMSSIVQRPDAYSPVLTSVFADYAQSRGIFVDPARVRHPRDKARVENQVPYARESLFAGEDFRDFDELRERAAHWCRDIAGMRIHGTTRKRPREAYELLEKPAMLPAPAERYDVPIYVVAKVHPDHHVQIARALYSVPTAYVHKQVQVRADSALVKIYLGATLIKVHKRVRPGERSTDETDYPSHKIGYATRSLDSVIKRSRAHGEHVAAYAEALLSGPHPWARMRQAYALLRLVEKYGEARVNAVCATALSFEVVDVNRISKMLKRALMASEPSSDSDKVVQLPLPRFARPTAHFSTRKGGKS